MKTKKSLWIAAGLFAISATTINAQIAINNTAANPDPSAILDLKSGNSGVNKGFLPQSVALTNVNTAAPVTGAATGLIVYSSTAPTGGNGTGYYYWTGTAWASLNSTISGSGTTNYVARWTSATNLGTGMIQDNGTGVGINSAPQAGDMLYVNSSAGTAVYGFTTVEYGVYANSTDGSASGVYGVDNGSNGYGVWGSSTDAAGVGVYGGDNTAGSTGVWGSGGTYGVYGESADYGVYGTGTTDGGYFQEGTGKNYAYIGNITDGVGVYANGVNYGGYFKSPNGAEAYVGYGAADAGGVFLDSTHTDEAITGWGSTGIGVFGQGTSRGGYFADTNGDYTSIGYEDIGTSSYGVNYGVIAKGAYEGVLGVTNTASSAYGLVGGNNAASGTGNGIGTYGSTYQSGGFGIFGGNYYGTANTGIGIYGKGSATTGTLQNYGEGVYSEGVNTGIESYCDASTGQIWDGYFSDATGNYAAVGYYSGTTAYKVVGSGSNATIIKDANNNRHTMVSPEAPEILFEDYGTASLSNGKVHIDLDPTYARNVTINEKHALRVMVTLNDQCNGVYVTNRTSTGFDVVELSNGTSNASFTYEVIANRADSYDDNGKMTSKNADIRYDNAPEPRIGTKTQMVKPTIHISGQSAKVAAPARQAIKHLAAAPAMKSAKANSLNNQ